jgi:hypothetical protein
MVDREQYICQVNIIEGIIILSIILITGIKVRAGRVFGLVIASILYI